MYLKKNKKQNIPKNVLKFSLNVSLKVRFDIKAKWFINRLSNVRKQGQKLSIRS